MPPDTQHNTPKFRTSAYSLGGPMPHRGLPPGSEPCWSASRRVSPDSSDLRTNTKNGNGPYLSSGGLTQCLPKLLGNSYGVSRAGQFEFGYMIKYHERRPAGLMFKNVVIGSTTRVGLAYTVVSHLREARTPGIHEREQVDRDLYRHLRCCRGR